MRESRKALAEAVSARGVFSVDSTQRDHKNWDLAAKKRKLRKK